MKLPKTERKILAHLKKRYVETHGTQQSHLDDFTIFVIDDGLKKLVPDLYGSDSSLTELKAVFRELASRGLVKIHGADRNYSITKEGFAHASKGKVGKIVEYFNTNPGLAILISLVSLVLSVVALFNS